MRLSQIKDAISLLFLIGGSVVSVVSAFHAGEQKLAEFKLEVEEKYARKDDMKAINDKLTIVSNDVGEIKGMLKARAKTASTPKFPHISQLESPTPEKF